MTPTELAAKASISVPYASQLLTGQRKSTSLRMALQIYDAAGLQFGPLVNLSPRDITAMRKLIEKAAA